MEIYSAKNYMRSIGALRATAFSKRSFGPLLNLSYTSLHLAQVATGLVAEHMEEVVQDVLQHGRPDHGGDHDVHEDDNHDETQKHKHKKAQKISKSTKKIKNLSM